MILAAHERHLSHTGQVQRREQPAKATADDQYARPLLAHELISPLGLYSVDMLAK